MATSTARGLSYKGYTGSVEYDPDDHKLHGRLLGIRDIVTYVATTVTELEEEFRTSVDEYLAWCAEDGGEPQRPYSGTMNLRLGSDLHRAAAVAAELSGESLNSWIVGRVAEAAARFTGNRRAEPAATS